MAFASAAAAFFAAFRSAFALSAASVAARSSASSSGAGMGTLVLVARTTSEEPRLHRCPRGGYAADGASEARALCRRNCAVLAVTVG
jgi:hypothetical protein